MVPATAITLNPIKPKAFNTTSGEASEKLDWLKLKVVIIILYLKWSIEAYLRNWKVKVQVSGELNAWEIILHEYSSSLKCG